MNLPLVILKNIHSQKALKVEINVQNTDAQMLLILLFKNMLILTGKNLSYIYILYIYTQIGYLVQKTLFL